MASSHEFSSLAASLTLSGPGERRDRVDYTLYGSLISKVSVHGRSSLGNMTQARFFIFNYLIFCEEYKKHGYATYNHILQITNDKIRVGYSYTVMPREEVLLTFWTKKGNERPTDRRGNQPSKEHFLREQE